MASDQQASDSPSEEPKTKRQIQKLADLSEDVLGDIFFHLDVQDLINVVTSSKLFLNSARRTFKRKYKSIQVPYKDPRTNTSFSDALLLRYFGESMSSLEVRLDCNYPNGLHIFHLIVTCCNETLTELTIFKPTAEFNVNKSFAKVRQLTVSKGHLNLTSSQLVERFPLLENLVLNCVYDVASLLQSDQKITSLKRISLVIGHGPIYRIQDLNNFIAVNSQLNDIFLNLKDFTFKGRMMPNVDGEVATVVELMSVKLNVYEDQFEHSTSLAQLNIATDRIAHLDLHFSELNAQICDYVTSCVNIKTLKISVNLYPWTDYSDLILSDRLNFEKFKCLTRLEISMGGYKDFFQFVPDLIEPFLSVVGMLDTVTVRLSNYQRTKAPKFSLFSGVWSKIDAKIWSLGQEFSRKEVSFTIDKITA